MCGCVHALEARIHIQIESVWFVVHSGLSTIHPYLILERFHYPKRNELAVIFLSRLSFRRIYFLSLHFFLFWRFTSIAFGVVSWSRSLSLSMSEQSSTWKHLCCSPHCLGLFLCVCIVPTHCCSICWLSHFCLSLLWKSDLCKCRVNLLLWVIGIHSKWYDCSATW